MKATTTFVALSLLAGVAFGAPLQRRSASTVTVFETVTHINTVWVNQNGVPVSTETAAPKATDAKPTVPPAEATPTTAPAQKPAKKPTEKPTVPEVAAVEVPISTPTSTPAPVKAAAVSTTKPPVSKPTTATPEVNTPSSTPTSSTTPPKETPKETESSSGDSGSPSGRVYSGDITYYTPGLGSCGETHSDSDYVVAMAAPDMGISSNPNRNPNCGRSITIRYEGRTTNAKVYDTCPECSSGSIDLSPSLFKAVAPNGDGRVHGVEWWFTS